MFLLTFNRHFKFILLLLLPMGSFGCKSELKVSTSNNSATNTLTGKNSTAAVEETGHAKPAGEINSDEANPDPVPPVKFSINAASKGSDLKNLQITATGLSAKSIVRIDASLAADCSAPAATLTGELPLMLSVNTDGNYYICGFLVGSESTGASNNPVSVSVDTTAPAAAFFTEETYGEQFILDLAVSDLSSYTVAWTVVSGGGKVTIGQPTSSVTSASASEEGDYTVKAEITDAKGHVTERLIPFKWRYCAGPPLTNSPFANSGEPDAGTVTNPFRICSLSQLDQMRTSIAAHYELWTEIDASPTSTWNSGSGFSAIGDTGTGEFTGVFNGRELSINGLFINNLSGEKQGLFSTSSGQIKDLNIINANVTGASDVGLLVGMNKGLVSNVRTSGMVTNTSGTTGGIAGYNWGGTIELSQSSATVTGASWTGGLVGANLGWDNPVTILRDSFATGNVSGYDYVGGLIGGTWGSNSQTLTSYATGNATGNASVGGLAGNVNTGAYVTNCHASGNASGVDRIGGFVGYNYRSRTRYSYSTGVPTGTSNIGGFAGSVNTGGGTYSITGTYWDTQTSGKATTAGASTGLTTVQMKQQGSFTSLDFAGIWTITEDTTYPALKWTAP